jgi:hypothetical protein
MLLHNLKGSFRRAVTALILLGGAAITALAVALGHVVALAEHQQVEAALPGGYQTRIYVIVFPNSCT